MEQKKLTQKQKRNIVIQAYKDFSTTEAGKIILADLSRKFNRVTLGQPIDPHRTHVDLGKMHVYDYINEQINRDLLEENENV